MKTAAEAQTTRSYKSLPVKDIKIDYSYQRPLRDTHRKIALNYDANRLGTIIVSNRGSEKIPDYYVIDGQHRLESFKIMEKTEIPALVITGLTIEEEMKIFVKQDELRARISGSDIYNAGKNLPGSLDNRLFHICQATGVHCVDSNAKTSIAGPRAYSAYRKAIKLHGDDIVQKVFTIYKQCKHTNDTTLYNRYMFDALINLVTDKNVEYNTILDALNTFETIGEIYNAANQANMYAYANNVDLTNVIRGRIKILAKKKKKK